MPNIFQRAESDDDVKALLADASVNNYEAATRLGTSEASVRRYRGRFPANGATEAPEAPVIRDVEDVEETLSPEDQVVAYREANARLFKQLSESKQRGAKLIQAVYDASHDAAEATAAVVAPKPKADRRKNKTAEVALWHLTDWQNGKVTSTYDSAVCERRVKQYVSKAQQITEIMRADHPVRHGIVLLTGDMLEGACIFPGQEWEVDATLFEQVFATVALEEYVIKQALETYETVDVVCEWGNHGRIGKKSDNYKPSDNVDRIIYQIVKDRLRHEKRIKNFQVSDDWYQHFSVGNYNAIAVHGDEIKSFGGQTPAYGIVRKANAWASGVTEPFRDMYIGHYHQNMTLNMANGGSVYMAGSTESDNEYAREFVAGTSLPSQRLHFIDPEVGFVTYESRIWLD